MNFKFNSEKNQLLKDERGICFEDVIHQLNAGNVLDIIKRPNEEKYPNQKIYILLLLDYVYMVPYVKVGDEIFLKTIIPSRKMNKIYKERIL